MSLRLARRAGSVCVLLALAGCGGAVRVEPPEPEPEAAAACRTLADRLPRTLDGAERTESVPASPYVAVWGGGEVTLRCGVPRPANMSATDQVPVVNDVAWFQDPVRPLLYTSVGRAAHVEVTISREHAPDSVLVGLAAPITAALPQTG
ncbi:DUF3515 domain-containing protein [Planomonospora corallina]|uniref:DUF3515 domain-containing protein n=1 Tax=Planomonospora corallina TaxID=1806052 RepID=A0ABV8IDY8_9ACTN